jgi:hypothetical protein
MPGTVPLQSAAQKELRWKAGRGVFCETATTAERYTCTKKGKGRRT